VGNVGLALVRLEMMTDMVLTAGETSRWSAADEFMVSRAVVAAEGEEEDLRGTTVKKEQQEGPDEVKIKAFVPEWHRSKTKAKVANRQVG